MVDCNPRLVLRVNIPNIIRVNYKQYTGKPHGRIVAMVLFGLPVTFAITMEKTVTSFLPFRLPCFCVLEPSRFRIASMDEIQETIFHGFTQSQNDRKKRYKMQMSIIVSENRGT